MREIIDFHSHILPDIDDGSASVEESIALLRQQAEQGIRHVVATPHFYPQYDNPEHFLKKRAEAETALRQQMQAHTGLPTLSIGAEVYFFHGISESDAITELTIDQKRCILIEMIMPPWSDSVYRELEGLHTKRGLVPIIAHLDRYIRPFHTHKIPERLAELPVLVQANAEFFTERSTASMALRMLKKNQIHLLGSDCHNLTDRKPNLGAALDVIEKKLGDSALKEIRKCQQFVLEGE